MSDRTAVDLLRSWLQHIEGLEVDACIDLLADDAVMLVPLAPEGLPRRTEGKPQIEQLLGLVGQMFRDFRFADVEVHGTDDPELAVATARSEIVLTNGDDYTQDYVFFVRARDGRIVGYTEYMDPVRARAAVAALS